MIALLGDSKAVAAQAYNCPAARSLPDCIALIRQVRNAYSRRLALGDYARRHGLSTATLGVEEYRRSDTKRVGKCPRKKGGDKSRVWNL